VASIRGNPGEIHELARYEVRPEALKQCLAAIEEFVAWRDAEANRLHGESAAVKKFAGILYPNCLAPVEFIEYRQVDANAAFRRI
jgi:hypothetical protein